MTDGPGFTDAYKQQTWKGLNLLHTHEVPAAGTRAESSSHCVLRTTLLTWICPMGLIKETKNSVFPFTPEYCWVPIGRQGVLQIAPGFYTQDH